MFRKKAQQAGGARFPADWVVAGLGNPGPEHTGNRHNVGFWVIDELARRAGTKPKTQGSTMQLGLGTLAGERVALVKPKTFMNLSGKAVAQALSWTGCALDHTIVVCDQLDLAAGALRIRAGGGHGGHNGLKSIGAAAGLDFVRIRVGIGRPAKGGEPAWDPAVVAGWVLSDPTGADRATLREAAGLAADAVECIIAEGVDAAAARFNRR